MSQTESTEKYGFDAHGYLRRARARLDEGTQEALFYAAFELRSGVEARMRGYLEFQDEVSKKVKEGYRINVLGKAISNIFEIGDKVAEFSFYRSQPRVKLGKLYYTPVTSALQGYASRMGDLLHVPNVYHPPDDPWWDETRQMLEEMWIELARSCAGCLMGLPPISPEGQMSLYAEADDEVKRIARLCKAMPNMIFKVKNLDRFPAHLEPAT